MKSTILSLFSFLFLSISLASKFSKNKSSPFITNYKPIEYNADLQNWWIDEDSLGILYFANSKGLLTYDGASWNIYPVNNKSTLRSIDIGDDSTIYAGAINDLGYYKKTLNNSWKYHSIVSLVDSTQRDFDNVWTCHSTSHGVYYGTERYLFQYLDEKLKSWEIKSSAVFHIGDNIYMFDYKDGIYEISSKGQRLICKSDLFKKIWIVSMIPFDATHFLIVTLDKGVYILNKDGGIKEFEKLNKEIKGDRLHFIVELKNKTFAIASLNRGVFIIDYLGNIIEEIKKENRLLSQSIWYLHYRKKQGELWAALDNGISMIEVDQPFRYWSSDFSNFESIYYVHHFKKNDKSKASIYFSTSNGVSRVSNGSIEKVEGIFDQCMELCTFATPKENILLCSSTNGVYMVEGLNAKKVFDRGTPISLYQPKGSMDLYLGGAFNLHKTSYDGNGWYNLKTFKHVSGFIRSIKQDKFNNLWVNTDYKGIYKLKNDTLIKLYDTTCGLPSQYSNYLELFEGRIVLSNKRGIFGYDTITDKFVPDSTFGSDYVNTDRKSFYLKIFGDSMAYIGAPSKENAIEKIKRNSSGVFIRDSLSFSRITPLSSAFFSLDEDNQNKVWIGIDEWLFTYDLNKSHNNNYAYPAIIKEVKVNGKPHNLKNRSVLPYNLNSLAFIYTASNYVDNQNLKFSYFLEGYDNEWSNWSTLRSKDYTNLPPGTYIFRVKAKNFSNNISSIAKVSFIIRPPWFSNGIALLIYFSIFILIINFIVRYRTLKLKRLKENLESEVKKRTTEIILQKEEIQAQNEEIRTILEEVQVKNERILKQKDELTLAYNKMLELEDFKDSMTQMIIHDLKNPLNNVIGFASLSPNEKRSSAIKFSGLQMLGMIESILDVQKFEQKGVKLKLTKCNLNYITERALNELIFLVNTKQLVLVNNVERIYIRIDGDLIQRVLTNLLSNAVKYSPNNGIITINAIEVKNGQENYIRISVTDQGSGIPKDMQEKIFEKYEQSKAKKIGAARSTGLGLSFCKMVVEAHQGIIAVNSKEEEGAEFYLLLPVI